MSCKVPPAGWRCTRDAGHAGPCASVPDGCHYCALGWPILNPRSGDLRHGYPKGYKGLRAGFPSCTQPRQRWVWCDELDRATGPQRRELLAKLEREYEAMWARVGKKR